MTDTTLPRTIDRNDVEVGQTIRVSFLDRGDLITHEFVVARIAAHFVESVNKRTYGFDSEIFLWELIKDVPAPPVKSMWEGSDGDTYIVTSQKLLACITGERVGAQYPLKHIVTNHLTPVHTHGEGCSPWMWSEKNKTAYVEQADGSYGPVHGDGIQLCGPSERHHCIRNCAALEESLVPWSERTK